MDYGGDLTARTSAREASCCYYVTSQESYSMCLFGFLLLLSVFIGESVYFDNFSTTHVLTGDE